jgi:hypothetical protein
MRFLSRDHLLASKRPITLAMAHMKTLVLWSPLESAEPTDHTAHLAQQIATSYRTSSWPPKMGRERKHGAQICPETHHTLKMAEYENINASLGRKAQKIRFFSGRVEKTVPSSLHHHSAPAIPDDATISVRGSS